MRLGHVNLSVDDVEAARAFYGGVMGLALAPRPADAGRPGAWYLLEMGELHVSLEVGADNRTSKRHVAFELATLHELEAWRARFTAAGVKIESGAVIAGVQRFFVRDPAGNRLELYVRGA